MAGDLTTPELIARLATIVGRKHVLTGEAAAPFSTGYRTGGGAVAAAVRPGSLLELWRALQACVAADVIVIVQAANTGLTGGSTPDGAYERPVIVLSTLRIRAVRPIRSGRQAICLAGATLHDLEGVLAPFGREPHSVIGSSCIGASVVGGVCNNSGGALVARGPAYTEYALYAQVDGSGRLQLRNHLGVRLGEDPETILRRLEAGDFNDADIDCDDRAASAAADYGQVVRDVDALTPARFNADPRRLFEASGSAGKLVVFAVRLDTFPRVEGGGVFYVGVNDPGLLTRLRRRLLTQAQALPVSGEYIHREAFDLADRYGKDTVLAIRTLGTDRLPALFRLKAWLDRVAGKALGRPVSLADHVLQRLGRLLPDHLPTRLRAWRNRYEHHLILKVGDDALGATRAALADLFPSDQGDVFQCTPAEAEAAMLHRFAVAGAAIRRRAVEPAIVGDILALDIALPRNAADWVECLPPEIEAQLVGKLYYGHFLCHVFHQDYLVRPGVDAEALEHRLLALMDARGAEYPAEHNVGHLYPAKSDLADHYRRLDPSNRLNPGIGMTSRRKDWQ